MPLGATRILAQTPPDSPSPLGSALTGLVRASHARHLDAAELERVGRDLQSHARMLESLRAFPLANADEPDFSFASLVERW